MFKVSMKQLLEAGVHFGHQANRWNPKMKKYIFIERNGIYIIDLQKTLRLFKDAYQFVQNITAEGGIIIFIGTKKQAQDVIREEAQRSAMPYVNQRWLGGMITNFDTIQKSLARLKKMQEMKEEGNYSGLVKKEIGKIEKKRQKMEKVLKGIMDLERVPDALFIIDIKRERIAVNEANKLDIPVIAIVDTNSDPDGIQYPIPANDDAIRSVKLITSTIADAAIEGRGEWLSRLAKDEEEGDTVKKESVAGDLTLDEMIDEELYEKAEDEAMVKSKARVEEKGKRETREIKSKVKENIKPKTKETARQKKTKDKE
ncbi:30S ribosomal protein S2 [bacterium]|nr:30S ribosomal protein S2 [bacterium]